MPENGAVPTDPKIEPGLKNDARRGLRELFLSQQFAILVALIVMCIVFATLSPYFFTVSNLVNIARQVSVIAIISFGMTYVILIAGIDLSVGSVVAAAGVMAAAINIATGSLFWTLLSVLPTGLLVGMATGMIITTTKIPDFIATLATLGIIRGVAMVATKANPIYGFTEEFLFLGQGYLGPIPFPVILAFGVFFIAHFVLKFTKFGCHIYAVGGNRQAARTAGININGVRIVVYGISGFAAALSGIVLAARVAAGIPIAGQGYELDAIASVILGGTNLFGGKGTLPGTLLGVLVMGVLGNGLVLLGMNPFYVIIAKGLILLIAVVMSTRPKTE